MKIGVLSDTHGNITALKRALDLFANVDLIVHAGDVLYHPPRLGCTEAGMPTMWWGPWWAGAWPKAATWRI